MAQAVKRVRVRTEAQKAARRKPREQWIKHPPPMTEEQWIERFDQLWCPEPNTGCHLWLGGLDKYGYGRFAPLRTAHRFAVVRSGRSLSARDVVMHICDTPACVNPRHLAVGTQTDNMRDMQRKDRARNPPRKAGDAHPMRKLDSRDVERVRAGLHLGVSQTDVSRLLGVSIAAINQIARGRSWAT